jgi:iron complex outermembrane recepter protein
MPKPVLLHASAANLHAQWVRGSLVAFACAAIGALPLCAREAVTWNTKSFADMSIEELLGESVTSVSKREQKLGDAAAAVSVLSNDDLRRSGFTNVADALRLIPGMNVGSVNSHQWAISARGFNNLYANKLLVLMDGRAVYTPLFAGVYWDMRRTSTGSKWSVDPARRSGGQTR